MRLPTCGAGHKVPGSASQTARPACAGAPAGDPAAAGVSSAGTSSAAASPTGTSPAGARSTSTPGSSFGSAGAILRPLRLGARWATPAAAGGLAVAAGLLVGFGVLVDPFDFNVYRWGGGAVTHGMRLYLVQVSAHWFTYPPFAAVVFIPVAAVPDVLGRVCWELVCLLALAVSADVTLKLAGYRPNWQVIAAVTVLSIMLEPMYHTFYLGQVNLMLLALILIDIWRTSRGRPTGIGIGIAAAVKLTPLIFIPLLFLARRTRDGLTALASFVVCGLAGYLVAPGDSRLYWHKLFDDTGRVSAAYISNQSPYATAVRIAGGAQFIGHWYDAIPAVLGIAGLVIATVLARSGDWLGAATVTGVTGLLVSPISWTHHWTWILPALVVLLRGGRRGRAAAAAASLLFVLAPMWFTPYHGGTSEYGFHWLVTAVANCYPIAGLAFLGYMAGQARLAVRGRAGEGDEAARLRTAQPAPSPVSEH